MNISLDELAYRISQCEDIGDLIVNLEKAYPGFLDACAEHDPSLDVEAFKVDLTE